MLPPVQFMRQKNSMLVESKKLNPKNIYSLTKKNNEDLAELYKNYYGLKLVGLRFFTVYREWEDQTC